MEKLRELLEQCLGQNFVHMIISNPRKLDEARKIDVRPYEERGSILFQFSEYRNNQVFHQNRTKEEALEQILKLLAGMYRQMEFRTAQKQYTVLVSKKGKVTIKSRLQKHPVKIELILIRAVKTEKKHGNDRRCYTMCKEFGICTTLEDLWKREE